MEDAIQLFGLRPSRSDEVEFDNLFRINKLVQSNDSWSLSCIREWQCRRIACKRENEVSRLKHISLLLGSKYLCETTVYQEDEDHV